MKKQLKITTAILAFSLLFISCSPAEESSIPDTDAASSQEDTTAADIPDGSEATVPLPVPANPSQPEDGLLGRHRRTRANSFGHLMGDLEAQWGVGPLLLPPGVWTTGQLGTEVSIELDRPWIMSEESPDHLSLIPPVPGDGPQSVLFLMRPRWIVPPAATTDPDAMAAMLGGAESTAQGFAPWVNQVEEIDVVSTEELEISGQPTTRYEIEVTTLDGPALGCIEGRSCVASWIPVAASGWRESLPIMFVSDAKMTVWEIEMPEANLIALAREQTDSPGFLVDAERVVEQLQFRDIGPPSMSASEYASIGGIWFPSFGRGEPLRFLNLGPDFVFDPGDKWFWGQDGWLFLSEDANAIGRCHETGIVVAKARYRNKATLSREAETYDSADAFIAEVLSNERIGANELSASTVLGRPAQVLEIADGEWMPVFTNKEVDDPVVACGPRRVWVTDSTDGDGPWVILADEPNIDLAESLFAELDAG